MLDRLWQYQKERFALAAFVPLALAVGGSAAAFSALLRSSAGPSASAVAGASLSAFLLWMQMRVLDEFKDAADDARHRPYRAVPRGLVTLGELRAVLLVAAAIEVAMAVALDARLLAPLAATWAWLGLTAVEFFAPAWLRARPGAYMASHCPGGFVIAVYLTAFDWLPAAASPHPALLWFGLAAMAGTVLLEIGRKVRAPPDEEAGVVTYSAAWGPRRAAYAWLSALLAALAAGFAAACAVGFAAPFVAALAPVGVAGALCCAAFAHRPGSRGARRLERISAIATLLLFVALGPAPLVLAASAT